MPRDVICDQCSKDIGMDYNAWFSSSEKDLDFCSERCYSQWTSNHDIQNHKKYVGISAVEEAIKRFENQGIPLADLQRIFYHENLFREGVKKCRVSSCHCIAKLPDKDYCPYHENLEQEQNQLKPLVKQRTSIFGDIQEVERFKTWWSKDNIATIITYYNSSYSVFLGVIDRKPDSSGRVENNEIFVFPTNFTCSYWGENSRKQHNYLSDAQTEANWLRTELSKGYGKYHDNPILLIHPYSDCSRSFSEFVCEPYVKKLYNLPYNTDNWDNYCKPFSVIRVWKRDKTYGDTTKFQHVGIYLGNNQVCHIYGYDEKDSSMEATITHVNTFLGDTYTTERCGGVEAFQPVIPFGKNISQRIAWAENVKFRKGDYDLFNRNCAHFTHMIIFWINYCDQSADKSAWKRFVADFGKDHVSGWKWVKTFVIKPWWWTTIDAIRSANKSVNNDKGNSICLRNEISEVGGKIKELNNWRSQEIEERYEMKIEQSVNVNNCIIM